MFFSLLLLGLLLAFSGVMSLNLLNIIFAVIIWIVGVPILAKLAVYDSHFKDIVTRSIRYSQSCLPASGKLGKGLNRVSHKRWA